MSLPRGVTAFKDLPTLATKTTKKLPALSKLSFFLGDITKLQVDVIVNAANSQLQGGGGVDGAIHNAAGPELYTLCAAEERPLEAGDVRVTKSARLSSYVSYIVHAVGPKGTATELNRKKLISCYEKALEVAKDKEAKSIAFPCISTGIYGYPNSDAAFHVLKFLTEYLCDERKSNWLDRVVLCLFTDLDKKFYNEFIEEYIDNSKFFERQFDIEDWDPKGSSEEQ